MRKNLVLLALILAGLVGCAKNYGSFIDAKSSPPDISETLAEGAAKEIAALYPPARTHIKFEQKTPDKFGLELLSSLRSKGFAVAAQNAPATEDSDTTSYQSLSLRYVLDATDKNSYRVMIFLGNQTIARAYVVKDNALAPAGAWVRKE
ncbi:MAG: conjugal transfer protein TrbH [Alphaproteobacteria bacterium]|nr:conjugal transfer protein TrbH [Alphaproteobacteria bacterium]